jgi:hypothetical protein
LYVIYFLYIDKKLIIYYNSCNLNNFAGMKLHDDGYEIFKNAIEINEFILNEFIAQSNACKAIFNFNNNKKDDRKRKQTPVKKNKKIIKDFVNGLKNFANGLNDKLVMNNPVIIKSMPNCQEQAPHTDYLLTLELMSLKSDEIPLAMIIALENNTCLNVWSGSISIGKKRKRDSELIDKTIIKLDKGDILIFRADLIHAGSAYNIENIRLHAFLDNPKIKRKKNSTNIIYDNKIINI